MDFGIMLRRSRTIVGVGASIDWQLLAWPQRKQPRKTVKVGIPSADLPDTMLAHADVAVCVVTQPKSSLPTG